jgi:hypothetical protein
MQLINREDIENMMEVLHSNLEESTLIHIDDEGLSKRLKYHCFLQQCPRDNSEISLQLRSGFIQPVLLVC